MLILSVFFINPVEGQEGISGDVGLNEKLGQSVPLELTFRDERGLEMKLKDIIDKPVVLTLVYYRCDHICPQMLLGLSEVLSKLELIPGKDYKVITLSFDDTDTPASARNLKLNYIKAINKSFPEDSWKFLTGDRRNIEKISNAVGIKYMKLMRRFIHPEVLVFISPDGMITRYLHVSTSSYGLGFPVMFSPIEFTDALSDASRGIIRTGIKKSPLLCFPHEPALQEKFFRILGIFGTVTLLLILSLFIYLKITSKKSTGG